MRLRAENLFEMSFVRGLDGLGARHEAFPRRREMKRIGPPVPRIGSTLREATRFEEIEQRDEIRALDAERGGRFRLLQARPVLQQG